MSRLLAPRIAEKVEQISNRDRILLAPDELPSPASAAQWSSHLQGLGLQTSLHNDGLAIERALPYILPLSHPSFTFPRNGSDSFVPSSDNASSSWLPRVKDIEYRVRLAQKAAAAIEGFVENIFGVDSVVCVLGHGSFLREQTCGHEVDLVVLTQGHASDIVHYPEVPLGSAIGPLRSVDLLVVNVAALLDPQSINGSIGAWRLPDFTTYPYDTSKSRVLSALRYTLSSAVHLSGRLPQGIRANDSAGLLALAYYFLQEASILTAERLHLRKAASRILEASQILDFVAARSGRGLPYGVENAALIASDVRSQPPPSLSATPLLGWNTKDCAGWQATRALVSFQAQEGRFDFSSIPHPLKSDPKQLLGGPSGAANWPTFQDLCRRASHAAQSADIARLATNLARIEDSIAQIPRPMRTSPADLASASPFEVAAMVVSWSAWGPLIRRTLYESQDTTRVTVTEAIRILQRLCRQVAGGRHPLRLIGAPEATLPALERNNNVP